MVDAVPVLGKLSVELGLELGVGAHLLVCCFVDVEMDAVLVSRQQGLVGDLNRKEPG